MVSKMEKIPQPLNGMGYIGRNYCPIWFSVSVSDLNQNRGLGHTLRNNNAP